MTRFITGIDIPSWEECVAWILRTTIFSSGMYQLIWGMPVLGTLIIAVLLGILFPSYFTKGAILKFPIEMEIVLLFIALITAVLGEGQNFYGAIPYYDKFVHALVPFFMGLFGFFVLYAFHSVGRVSLSPSAIAFVVILTMLGLQTVWEILEYASDKTQFSAVLAWEQAQGNAIEDPYHDTMNDLVVDTVGTVMGTALAFSLVKNGEQRAPHKVRTLLEKLKRGLKEIPRPHSERVYNRAWPHLSHEKSVNKQKPADKAPQLRASAQTINI